MRKQLKPGQQLFPPTLLSPQLHGPKANFLHLVCWIATCKSLGYHPRYVRVFCQFHAIFAQGTAESHHSDFQVLLSWMDCWFSFLFSTASHEGKAQSECTISSHQQQRSSTPSAPTSSVSWGMPPQLTVRYGAWLLAVSPDEYPVLLAWSNEVVQPGDQRVSCYGKYTVSITVNCKTFFGNSFPFWLL